MASFLLFQALYALTSSGNVFRVPDEFEVYYQVEHLVDAGDISVPQAVPRGQFFGRVGLDRKPYAPYGPFTAVLALPHHLMARGVAWIAGIPRDTISWTFVVSGLTMLTTSTGAALAVAGFYRAAMATGASYPAALLLSLMLGGASVLWTRACSRYFEGWQAAAFIWAAVCLLERIARASLLLAIAGLIKVTGLVFVPGFLAAVMVDRSVPPDVAFERRWRLARGSRSRSSSISCGTVSGSARCSSLAPTGQAVLPCCRPGLASCRPASGLAGAAALSGEIHSVVGACSGAEPHAARTCPRPLLIGVATTAICGLLFYGAYLFPEGGFAHGPRHLVPILPVALAGGNPGALWRRELVLACTAVGMAIALLSVSVSFLQDQVPVKEAGRVGYYERIDPPAGRAADRYRLDYVPFIRTTTSSEWPNSPRVGSGLDFFFCI